MTIGLIVSWIISILELCVIQAGGIQDTLVTGTGIPDVGTRVTILVLGVFLLMIGGAFVWLNLNELEEAGGAGETRKNHKERDKGLTD